MANFAALVSFPQSPTVAVSDDLPRSARTQDLTVRQANTLGHQVCAVSSRQRNPGMQSEGRTTPARMRGRLHFVIMEFVELLKIHATQLYDDLPKAIVVRSLQKNSVALGAGEVIAAYEMLLGRSSDPLHVVETNP